MGAELGCIACIKIDDEFQYDDLNDQQRKSFSNMPEIVSFNTLHEGGDEIESGVEFSEDTLDTTEADDKFFEGTKPSTLERVPSLRDLNYKPLKVTPNEDGTIPLFSEATLDKIYDQANVNNENKIDLQAFAHRPSLHFTREKLRELMGGTELFREEMFEDGTKMVDKDGFKDFAKKYWVHSQTMDLAGAGVSESPDPETEQSSVDFSDAKEHNVENNNNSTRSQSAAAYAPTIDPNEDGSIPLFSDAALRAIFKQCDSKQSGVLDLYEFAKSPNFIETRNKLQEIVGHELFTENYLELSNGGHRSVGEDEFVKYARTNWVHEYVHDEGSSVSANEDQ